MTIRTKYRVNSWCRRPTRAGWKRSTNSDSDPEGGADMSSSDVLKLIQEKTRVTGLLKFALHNVGARHNKSVTFMPKPLVGTMAAACTCTSRSPRRAGIFL